MPDRFFVPGAWSGSLELDGPEAHHLARVLRAKPGDEVEVFDGRGRSAQARVAEVGKRTVRLELSSEVKVTSQPRPQRVLAVASPKGDRLRWMIEKMTELGVDRFIPLKTTRSVVDPSETKLARLEQTVIAACKQSRRDWLLEVDEVCPLAQLPTRLNLDSTWIVWGEAAADIWSLADQPHPLPETLVAVVGPEGGFTDEERGILREWGARPISLSSHVLRVETAAIAWATVLQTCRS